MSKKVKTNGAVAPTHVRKNWMNLLGACMALVLVFGATSCKKDKEDQNMFKSTTLVDAGIYDDFVPGDYWVNETWVNCYSEVTVFTTFRDGYQWGEMKEIQGDGIKSLANACYNFNVRTSSDGANCNTYSSLCASYGSVALGNATAYESAVLDPGIKAQIMSSFNYIYNNYGSLNAWAEGLDVQSNTRPITVESATKVVAQCVLWMILDYHIHGGIAMISPQYSRGDASYVYHGYFGKTSVNDGKTFDQVIEDAYAARNANVQGPVKDFAYLVGPAYPSDKVSMQPQIIPLTTGEPPKTPVSYATVTATNAGNVNAILASVNPKNGNTMWDAENPLDPAKTTQWVVPNSNHFVFANATVAQLQAGVALEFLVGNKFTVVTTGLVKLVGDNLEITINDLASGGQYGAIAFTQIPVTNNGNIHSQKPADLAKLGALTGFNHDGKLTIPCPGKKQTGWCATTEIWLYFHAGALNILK
jgi:hypothetical protein